jgi:gluconokinase
MIVILAGVAGSGKSTVGRILAARLGWPFEDSDLLHSASDIAKMVSGKPLTDADRWPWLETVATWIDHQITAGRSAVIACSALKRSYRDFLRHDRPAVEIVLIQVDEATLMARLAGRHDHFFPKKLLQSQLADLEMPTPGEPVLVVPADGTPAEMAGTIIDDLHLTPAQPNAAQPDAAQPDAAQPDAAQPDAPQPDASQADAPRPDAPSA